MTQETGLRLSKQRKIILEKLMGTTSHPTADELYRMVREALPKISLGTVYRNLEIMSQCGMIQKVGPQGTQMRFDGNAAPHPHIRCRVCGKVDDVHAHLDVRPLTDDEAMGYAVDGLVLEYYGVCPDCREHAD